MHCPWSAVSKKVYHVGEICIIWMASIGGHFWRSPKSAAVVTYALPLVCRFQKGISCRGKYALFGWPPLEVTFGGHKNQLQRSP